MNDGRALATGIALLIALAMAPGRARAHEDVEEGRRLYAEADFEGALAAFARALASDALTRADLTRLFEGRALAEYALEDLDAARITVRQLASIAPEHRMGEVVPPELVRMFEAAREELGAGITLRVDAEWGDEEVTLRPVLAGDVTGFVRRLSIAGRAEGSAVWERGDATGVRLALPADVAVEVLAEALGPGDAVLARVGEEASPQRLAREASGPLPGWGWALIGGGAGLVAVAIIVAVAVAASPASVQLSPPRLIRPEP